MSNIRYNQIRSGDRQGDGSLIATVATGAKTAGNYPQWDASGKLTDGNVGAGGSLGLYFGLSLSAPAIADYAWINQGGASAADMSPAGIHMSVPSGPNDIRVLKKTAPSVPYTVVAAFLLNGAITGGGSHTCGMLFRESGTGKVATFDYSTTTVAVAKWDAPGTFNANYDVLTHARGGILIFMKIEDDNANRICSLSGDGQNFIQVHSVGRTDFLTADEVGFFGFNAHATLLSGLSVFHWAES